jgi:hypothetical protein
MPFCTVELEKSQLTSALYSLQLQQQKHEAIQYLSHEILVARLIPSLPSLQSLRSLSCTQPSSLLDEALSCPYDRSHLCPSFPSEITSAGTSTWQLSSAPPSLLLDLLCFFFVHHLAPPQVPPRGG